VHEALYVKVEDLSPAVWGATQVMTGNGDGGVAIPVEATRPKRPAALTAFIAAQLDAPAKSSRAVSPSDNLKWSLPFWEDRFREDLG